MKTKYGNWYENWLNSQTLCEDYRLNMDNQRFKARLVPRGDKQEIKFKLEDTYAPVKKLTRIRIFL